MGAKFDTEDIATIIKEILLDQEPSITTEDALALRDRIKKQIEDSKHVIDVPNA